MSVPLTTYILGTSGNPAFGGYGAGGSMLKDYAVVGQSLTTSSIIQFDLSGKFWKCQGGDVFNYDGQTFKLLQRCWINVYTAIQLGDITNAELRFLLFSQEFGNVARAHSGFVNKYAVTYFSGDGSPGDYLNLGVKTDVATTVTFGEICITAARLPS